MDLYFINFVTLKRLLLIQIRCKMLEELDLFSGCKSRLQRLSGWQCQGTGEQIGSPIHIRMVKLHPSRSLQLMESSILLTTLSHLVGNLVRHSQSLYRMMQWRAYHFYMSSPPFLIKTTRNNNDVVARLYTFFSNFLKRIT